MSTPRHALFVRPNLGIGGAERWAVDAALALQAAGWTVEFAVNTFDPARTQPEARSGQIAVTVLGGVPGWCAGGRLRALTALVGQWRLLRRLRRRGAAPDLFVCDLVPHAAPWIRRWFRQSAVVVYCHYPDLPPQRARGPYALYRAALRRRETLGMQAAHRVLANSRYTAEAVRQAFPRLDPARLAIVHPGVRLSDRGRAGPSASAIGPGWAERRRTVPPGAPLASSQPQTLLTVGRFDRSKGLPLALATFATLRAEIGPTDFAGWRLVLAGGYDRRLPEARALVQQLRAQAAASGVAEQVEWHFDPAPDVLETLWDRAFALVHCAHAEHFGIVLIEAMARGLPVLAVDHGGPREIVADGVTGALRAPRAVDFAAVLAEWARVPARAASLGAAGRARAAAEFSLARFSADFVAQVEWAVRVGPGR